ncbi:cysteine hydrolase family protein [Desulfocurvus vexinensis]|uniref:cysteine hydrolase family protein n=1 Tax=Desulfocurvus vexinensis TaxID=399548 RepID=UPI0004B2FF4A|nr:isochorismatase family cysteine hydrolase [Desulfocurvus vexinensis]
MSERMKRAGTAPGAQGEERGAAKGAERGAGRDAERSEAQDAAQPKGQDEGQAGAQAVALLIIDMQEDFALPTGPLFVPGAPATVPALARLLALGRARGWAVFHVLREHAPDGSDAEITRRGLFTGGGGFCLPGTPGARIVEPLRPLPGETCVVKKRFSAFFGTDLHARLTALGVGTVVLGGTQYPNCIRATATDALARDYRVIVVTDCCSAATQAVAEANVADLRAMGLTCVPLAELPAALEG